MKRLASADPAWQRARHASRRWALWGAGLGLLLGLLLAAPASWLASAVYRASGERLLLADARGTVWQGHAVLVLAGGPGSQDASALPDRLRWRLRPHWRGLSLRLEQACCLHGKLRLLLKPAWSGYSIELVSPPGPIGQWPARWLSGLGTPWNTLHLGGSLQLSSTGFSLQQVAGRTRMQGSLDLVVQGLSSRVSPLDSLGSYRLGLRQDPAAGDAAQLSLDTLDGPLRLQGSGQWSGARLRFRGQAQAAPGQEAALANLLNLLGRRQGATALIAIG